jgi:hypothetical protein
VVGGVAKPLGACAPLSIRPALSACEGTLDCTYEPQRVVVDPDVTVLMLVRQKAEVKVKVTGEKLALR